ncbi:hypothetical protein LR48_Vigan10g252000 [Vigna angularis]|uniref:Uncharacterized protein n=1 Tax=Phaseolus angularis TaxID=3914 RepID=A0A0L9VNU7_PHAAN|nr:hypothetical protein LR48_Vigan10g252000 [Vigna angularis]
MIGGMGEDDDDKHKEYSAIYNFGDSNSDTGTFSAAFEMVFPPNGQNFPEKFPTRNCDGRLIIDYSRERESLLHVREKEKKKLAASSGEAENVWNFYILVWLGSLQEVRGARSFSLDCMNHVCVY